MVTRDFSGRDVVKALRNNQFKPISQSGSHVKLRYEHPDGEVRIVVVPLHDRVRTGTLHNIMDQAGGEDFEKFCQWIDRNR